MQFGIPFFVNELFVNLDMTVTVSLYNEEQERTLIEFLEKMHYEYRNDGEDWTISEAQKEEIVKRDNKYLSGETTTRNWDDIKRDLERAYR